MRLAALALFALSPLAAGDVTGTWVGDGRGNKGEPVSLAIQLRQNGTTLEGKVYGDYESTSITEGRVSGDVVTFVLDISEQAGNQINQNRLRFSGRVDGDSLEIVRDRERAKDAINGAALPIKNQVKQTFRLRKLL